MSDEIGLVTARIHELLENLESQESFGRIRQIKTEWARYKRSLKKDDRIEAQEAMSALNRLLHDADHEYLVWEDLYKALNMRQRLVKQEQKRLMDMDALVSTEEAVAFVTEVMRVVKGHVDDDRVKGRIYTDVMKILERRPSMAKSVGAA